jgi:di/tricarboxylate transporter
MIALPSLHAAATLLLTGIAFYLFAQARIRIELISLFIIATLALGFYFFPLAASHYTGMEIAFGGFGHEALVAICALMILGRGLSITGALEPAARILGSVWRANRNIGLLLTLVICGFLSMFVNDTPVMVLVLPILLNIAARAGESPSRSLMPANCAILIGGMTTTIGTSTNILTVSIARDLGVPPFGVFQFTGLALIAAAVALPYIWLVMPRLLPAGSDVVPAAQRLYDAVLHVTEKSPLIGEEGPGIEEKLGEAIAFKGIVHSQYAPDDPSRVRGGDFIYVRGTAADLGRAREDLKAPLAGSSVMEAIKPPEADPDHLLAEVVIGARSPLIGRSVRAAEIADRYRIAVMGTHFAHASEEGPRRNPTMAPLHTGDMLLLQGTPENLREFEQGAGVMILEGAEEMPRTRKAALALIIMAVVVGVAALRLVPIAISALAGVIALFATGCMRFDRVGRALSAEVVVLVAASIALGRALVETGAAAWMGGLFAAVLQFAPPGVAVAMMMLFATVMTNFISNAAAAAVGTPIAVSLATQIGVPTEPFVLAVLFGANLCFVTPMAYQTNLMIMTPGGYRFGDYVRAGLPLVVIMITTLTVLLVVRYGL